jgi:hypothetical protein
MLREVEIKEYEIGKICTLYMTDKTSVQKYEGTDARIILKLLL